MLTRLRERAANEQGFTLVELLVVMLILGLLAAIAIPAFFNQSSKAQDAQLKAGLQTAAVSEETYSTDNSGSYTTSLANLKAIEPTLNDTSVGTQTITQPAGDAYKISAVAASGGSGVTYVIEKTTGGVTTRTCTVVTPATLPKGGCSGSGTSGTW
jgi:type IV pilus assembly protein PilA